MYQSNETLTDINSLPFDQQEHFEPSQTESHLSLQLKLTLQEKEAATEMLKISQMALNNLEDVLDERRKSSSTEYIKNVKADYSEAIHLLNRKIDSLTNQIVHVQAEREQYRELNKDLEYDYQQIRERNADLEQQLSEQVKMVEVILAKDKTHDTVLSIDAINDEKQDIQEKLNKLQQENARLSEKCADLEHTSERMEAALRNSEQKLIEYTVKESEHVEAIKTYEKDLSLKKREVQNLNSKLQEQKMSNKEAIFELQAEMAGKITALVFEKTTLLNEKSNLENQVSNISRTLTETQKHLNQLESNTVDRSKYETLLDQLTEAKQKSSFLQNEAAQMMNDMETLANTLQVERQSFDNKISLMQYQLESLNTGLQDSRQHCQHLMEENVTVISQFTKLKSQHMCYQKILEDNSPLSTVEKCQQLEREKQNEFAEMEIYVAKYREQIKSWKCAWQETTDHFEMTLNDLRTQNENFRKERFYLETSLCSKCKMKIKDPIHT